MDLTAKKAAFAAQAVALCSQVLALAHTIDDLSTAYSVGGFNLEAKFAFTDEDFSVNNTHLSAASMADILFALGKISDAISPGIRNSLREGLPSGLP